MNKSFILCFLLIFQSLVYGIEENSFILSSGRSGTHLLMYTVSYLTKRSCGDGRFDEPAKVESSRRKIYQIHKSANALEWYNVPLDPKNDFLILIIRDYKEALMRATLDNYNEVLDILKAPDGSWGLELFENLEEFEAWNPERRLLIYYEDLITKPEIVCPQIVNFFKASDQYLNEFIENYKSHFEVPLQYYHQTHEGSYSKGKDFHYHTSLLPSGIEETMDELVMQRFPKLVEDYLKRYLKSNTSY